ncbi:hypothetical protein L227DRAFT_534475 [Lentinus tigrinus ALCF2SS1-6]|uniref:Uncharacterized protein n=2 Tax=Lentinus tigrinus TaxID=5365 RepID=A0A5C2RSJ3_9APHY|nr:hypothetical protein L227DRAFT_534475 [Lentinus tigrinus ALCF2SS1-6]
MGIVGGVRKQLQKRAPPLSSYTWIEDDVPEYLPFPGGPTWITQSIEESVRYSISQPESFREWLSTATTGSGGTVHYGPNHRLGIPAFAHEFHCLRALRVLLDDDGVPEGHELSHSEHCLSYLREHTLCAADGTLEPGDSFSRNYTAQMVIREQRCIAVDPYAEAMISVEREWTEFQSMNAIVTSS